MEVIVFAILALYLFFRLWGVLGTRTGNEKKIDPFKELEDKEEGNIIVMPKRSNSPRQVEQEEFSSSVASQINRLMEIDNRFDPSVFMKNSKAAFISIIKAFTEANHMTLKKLLSPSVYEQFATAIEEREKKNLRQETEIEDLHAEILNIDILDDRAQITVRFVSQQMVATINQENQSFDNPSRLQIPMRDIWTFERFFGSESPIWLLTRTRTENS
ncbi:MAG: Tim44/TimA family putative adaptor protein [Alphaproteobacteria bacterium]|nr:Tim44/TimA family putative adaptor protein [Alphaproteobacteria bacterium]